MSVKRKRRDKENRALSKGYRAGKRGRSKFSCPYKTDLKARQMWLAGWSTGWSESKYEGYALAESSDHFLQASGF